jgi:hypothetical protein
VGRDYGWLLSRSATFFFFWGFLSGNYNSWFVKPKMWTALYHFVNFFLAFISWEMLGVLLMLS